MVPREDTRTTQTTFELETRTIGRLLHAAASGRLALAPFARPATWQDEEAPELLETIMDGPRSAC